MNYNFKNYLQITEHLSQYGAIFVQENSTWLQNISNSLPQLQLDLPAIEKKSTIEFIADKKNPITVQLSDGSKLFFTYDEYKRIEGKPERGKTMVVTFQRLPNDATDLPSQITKCRII